MNPMQLIQMIQGGGNPMQLLSQMGQQNPMVGQVLNALLEAVIDGRCPNERGALMAIVADICH